MLPAKGNDGRQTQASATSAGVNAYDLDNNVSAAALKLLQLPTRLAHRKSMIWSLIQEELI
jgi:hypothetical protein